MDGKAHTENLADYLFRSLRLTGEMQSIHSPLDSSIAQLQSVVSLDILCFRPSEK